MSRTRGMDKMSGSSSSSDDESHQESEASVTSHDTPSQATSSTMPTPASTSKEQPLGASNTGGPPTPSVEPGQYRAIKSVVKEFFKQSGLRLESQSGRGKGRGKNSRIAAQGSTRSDDLHKALRQTIQMTRGKTLHQIILELMEGLDVNLNDSLRTLLSKITDMEEKIRINRRNQGTRSRSLIHLIQIDEQLDGEVDASDQEEDTPNTPEPASTPSPSSSQKRGLQPASLRFSTDSDSSQLRESTKDEDSFSSDGEIFLSLIKRTANTDQFELAVDLTRTRTQQRNADVSSQEGRELAKSLENEIKIKNDQLRAACAEDLNSSDDSVFMNPDRKRPALKNFEDSQPPQKIFREEKHDIIDEAAVVIFEWLDKIPTMSLCTTLVTFLAGNTVDTTVRKVKRFILQALLDMDVPESYWEDNSVEHGLDPELAIFLRENGWREILKCVHKDSIIESLNKLSKPPSQETELETNDANNNEEQSDNMDEETEEDTAPVYLSSPESPDNQEDRGVDQAEAEPLVPLGSGLVINNPISIPLEQHLAMQEELDNLMPNDNFPTEEEVSEDDDDGPPNLIIDISDEEDLGENQQESDADSVEILHEEPPVYSVNEDSSADEEN